MDRPRRTTRTPKRKDEPAEVVQPAPPKPRRQAKDRLTYLLESTKSPLTKINISDIINAEAWNALSEESREHLKTLLPPTAFLEDGAVDPGLFTDAHFLAAAHTFQDHIFSGWLTPTHKTLVSKYLEEIRAGTLAAPWKDAEWEACNQAPAVGPRGKNGRVLAGDVAEIKLTDLARDNVLLPGDILAYKRTFAHLGITIEKDVIIDAVDPKTRALTVFLSPGTALYLPDTLVANPAGEPSSDTQSMTVTSPRMLETGVLDLDARAEKSRRPNGNAWKCFTVWRWREFPGGQGERGGRENHGTLFYLRGCYYHEL
ncbi:Asx homology domain-containing protein [Infundibulicybe gibba]|nr:Asx homology domain-containing protein [Infundibulicybe gibba]